MLPEVERYLNKPCELPKEGTNWDVLKWWTFNAKKYKILSQIAHDFMTAQVLTVSFESTFNTRSQVSDFFRSSLRPKMVEALICAQSSLRVVDSDLTMIIKEEDEDYANTLDDI